MIGSYDQTVDEAKFTRRKNYVGRVFSQHGFLEVCFFITGICRETRECFLMVDYL
jgi:hypothetical protein